MTDQQKQRFDALTAMRRKWVEANHENGFGDGIKKLLTDLYPDNAHFIYELLQNAEDARAQTVRFTVTDKAVEFEHDGARLFSEQDIKSITSIGASAKKDDLTAIGKFGVGFKAVFAYTQTPEIHSGDFHFKIRDLVVPEAIPPCGDVNGKTTFIFPFDNPKKDPKTAIAEIERGLCELTDNTLLILSNIQEIEYLLPDGETLGTLKRLDTEKQPEVCAPTPAGGSLLAIHSLQSGTLKETVTHWLRYEQDSAGVNDDGQTATCRVAVAFKLEPQTPENPERAEKKTASRKARREAAAWRPIPCDPGQVSIFFPCDKVMLAA